MLNECLNFLDEWTMPTNWVTVNISPECSTSVGNDETRGENLIRNRLLKKLLVEETKKSEVLQDVLAGVEAKRCPYPIEPIEFRRIDIPSIPKHITEQMLESYFESIGHKLDDCIIEHKHNVNGMYRVVYICLFTMSEVDEVMRTRPHYIGEFQLQLRRYTMPGTEKRMAKRVAVETRSEEVTDAVLLSYMSHFGQVVKIEPLDRVDEEQFTSPELGALLVEFADGDAADKLVLCSPHYLFANEFKVRKLVEARKRDDAYTELIKHTEHRLDRKRIKQKRSADEKEKREEKRIAAVVEAFRPRNPLDGIFAQPDSYRTQKDRYANVSTKPKFDAGWQQVRPLMDLCVAPPPPPSIPTALASSSSSSTKDKPGVSTYTCHVSPGSAATTYNTLPTSSTRPIESILIDGRGGEGGEKVSPPSAKRIFIPIPRK